jgi:hypothetical protein
MILHYGASTITAHTVRGNNKMAYMYKSSIVIWILVSCGRGDVFKRNMLIIVTVITVF